jgi:hypothetical protein
MFAFEQKCQAKGQKLKLDNMTYLMNLEKLPILTNLKTFYYLGMEMNGNV